jgi:phosphatidylinositol alpha 1,6-mannosyltransferase
LAPPLTLLPAHTLTPKVHTSQPPRVAYFPDSYDEVNGVANTSRHFEAFARSRGFPFLMVRAGTGEPRFYKNGCMETLELPRSWFSFGLEKDLRYDLLFLRHLKEVTRRVKSFQPDLLHVTGPSELGTLGAILAHHFHLPLVASWHTNLHEYAARRARWMMSAVPQARRGAVAGGIERATLEATVRFYGLAKLLFAPNPQLQAMLEAATGRACRLMGRGVDTQLFSPARRTRPDDDREIVLGYVGRLSVEKNIGLLPKVQAALDHRGIRARFLIVGHGAEAAALQAEMPTATLPGVLRAEELAQAYSNMDCFVFPSHTDTFGNVVLEAMASGAPAVVTPSGGPAYLVEHGVDGLVASDSEFPDAIAAIVGDPARLQQMRAAARERALRASWSAIFEEVYQGYEEMLTEERARHRLGR